MILDHIIGPVLWSVSRGVMTSGHMDGGPHARSHSLQVIRVLVVRLQQQAVGWTSGNASHGTGKHLMTCYRPPALLQAISVPTLCFTSLHHCENSLQIRCV